MEAHAPDGTGVRLAGLPPSRHDVDAWVQVKIRVEMNSLQENASLL